MPRKRIGPIRPYRKDRPVKPAPPPVTANWQELVTTNMDLVPYFIGIAYGECSDEDKAAGNYGLVIAARMYDPSRGCKFSTYARAWILQSVGRWRKKNAPIHIPEYLCRAQKSGEKLTKGGSKRLKLAAKVMPGNFVSLTRDDDEGNRSHGFEPTAPVPTDHSDLYEAIRVLKARHPHLYAAVDSTFRLRKESPLRNATCQQTGRSFWFFQKDRQTGIEYLRSYLTEGVMP
jgi:hypothetical protein